MAAKKTKNRTYIQKILKKIVIPKRFSGRGNATEILFKMRYGNDWKKYYPVGK